jgi:ATP adenylyltransferase/5',5'''-P-1,P-4-tetraphosphate phosphorylase II
LEKGLGNTLGDFFTNHLVTLTRFPFVEEHLILIGQSVAEENVFLKVD